MINVKVTYLLSSLSPIYCNVLFLEEAITAAMRSLERTSFTIGGNLSYLP